MSDDALKQRQSELAFFGKISASVSHDIKNGLAIIKEQAGMVGDLMLMAETGRPLDAAKIKNLIGKILTRIDKTDEIVKDMNAFSHTTDDTERSVELGESLALIVRLSQRFANMNKVKILTDQPAELIHVKCNPFLLQQLLFCFILLAINETDKGGDVIISLEKTDGGAGLAFSGKFKNVPSLEKEPDENIAYIKQNLNADVGVAFTRTKITLDISIKSS